MDRNCRETGGAAIPGVPGLRPGLVLLHHASHPRAHRRARLRRPRPTFRRLAFQPGFVSLWLTAIIGLIDVDLTFYEFVAFPPPVEMVLPGAAVLASWSILAALGRWHPEASWIDRSGRLVGAFWLAMIPWSIWLQYF